MEPVAIDSDWLPWCKSLDMYITREELRDRILSGTRTIIVDVRDDDHQGVSEKACFSSAAIPSSISKKKAHVIITSKASCFTFEAGTHHE